MHVFSGNVQDLLATLVKPTQLTQRIPQDENPIDDLFGNFKKFTLHYIQDHDKLQSDHPAIGQIENFNTVDEIEQMLRANLDYCDDCMVKLFRKFISQGREEDTACGCGGE